MVVASRRHQSPSSVRRQATGQWRVTGQWRLPSIKPLVTDPPGQQLDDDEGRQDARRRRDEDASSSWSSSQSPAPARHHSLTVSHLRRATTAAPTDRRPRHLHTATSPVTCGRNGKISEITACGGLRTVAVETVVMYFSCLSASAKYLLLPAGSV